jgi:hypothetical protein
MANNNVTTAAALRSLRPESQWAVEQDLSGNDVVTWISGGVQPTADEITAERTRLQSAYDAKAYQRSRAAEYPSIADQLDDIYHNGVDGWKATIKTTKDKYPKE